MTTLKHLNYNYLQIIIKKNTVEVQSSSFFEVGYKARINKQVLLSAEIYLKLSCFNCLQSSVSWMILSQETNILEVLKMN